MSPEDADNLHSLFGNGCKQRAAYTVPRDAYGECIGGLRYTHRWIKLGMLVWTSLARGFRDGWVRLLIQQNLESAVPIDELITKQTKHGTIVAATVFEARSRQLS